MVAKLGVLMSDVEFQVDFQSIFTFLVRQKFRQLDQNEIFVEKDLKSFF